MANNAVSNANGNPAPPDTSNADNTPPAPPAPAVTPPAPAVTPPAPSPATATEAAPDVPARAAVSAPPRFRRVHKALLVTGPDGAEHRQGTIFDAVCFDAGLLAHYEERGFLIPVDPADVP